MYSYPWRDAGLRKTRLKQAGQNRLLSRAPAASIPRDELIARNLLFHPFTPLATLGPGKEGVQKAPPMLTHYRTWVAMRFK